MKEIITTTIAELYPNQYMKQYIDDACDYRRYVWNKALETWNTQYQKYCETKNSKDYPSSTSIQNMLTKDKEEFEYQYSSRIQKEAVRDLGKAWSMYIKKVQKRQGKPKFKSKKLPRQGFKNDMAKIVNGELLLPRPKVIRKDHWHTIPLSVKMDDLKLQTISVFKEKGKYFVALVFKKTVQEKLPTHKKVGIDANVGHFVSTDSDGNTYDVSVLPNRLRKLYESIAYRQRRLAKIRRKNKDYENSNNYFVMRTKLQNDYTRVKNIQKDILHKYTYQLIDKYDEIHIEDLDVSSMKMGIASKGLHRSLFGEFRRQLEYKSDWYGRKLILCDRFYPSTQKCSSCGHVKFGEDKITLSGNKKHSTSHHEYVCYICGYENDRDINASINILNYI